MRKSKFDSLVEVIRKLRSPNGCPWDREQTHATLKPYLIEEAYEALEAIDDRDNRKLCEELGDLLLQVVLHAQIAQEKKRFDIYNVIHIIREKMIRRHPHVFAKRKVKGVEEVWARWEEIKKSEAVKAGKAPKSSVDTVPKALPALYRADKVQRRAARVGFDWDNVAGAWEKVHEEIEEIQHLLRGKKQGARGKEEKLREEIGDLLFAIVNVARKKNIDAEEILRESTDKFVRRFKMVEEKAKEQKKSLHKMTLSEMDKLWNKVKQGEV